MKKSLFNIRPMLIAFVALMCGIILSRLFLYNSISIVTTCFVIAVMLSIAIVLFVFSYFKYSQGEDELFRLRVKRQRISAILLATMLMTGIVISALPLMKMSNVPFLKDDVTISGIITDYVDFESTSTRFVIRDCVIYEDTKMTRVPYKVLVYTGYNANLKLGDEITAKAELRRLSSKSQYDLSLLYNNIGYSVYIDLSEIKLSSSSPSLKDNIKNKIQDTIFENSNMDNGSLIFSILFGDKYCISEDIRNSFSFAGISHILAVSGLHISVLFGLIYFFLKKSRVNKYATLIICGCVLLFYSYLCSFTPSVTRASIMAVLLLLCKTLGVEYDSISSLSIAGIIILFFSPMSMFMPAFQLSFLCIFAIITLSPIFVNILAKIKCPNILAKPLSISFATTLGVMPICMNIFDKVGILGVLVNLLIIPLNSITYILSILILLPSFIIKSFGALLILPNILMHFVKTIANWVTSWGFGVFSTFRVGYWIILFIVLLGIIYKYLLCGGKHRAIICILILTIITNILYHTQTPMEYEGSNLILISPYEKIMIYSEDNVNTLIGSNYEPKQLNIAMKELRINKIDNIISFDFDIKNVHKLLEICNNYNTSNIYIPTVVYYDELLESISGVTYYENYLSIGSLQVYGWQTEDNIPAIKFDVLENRYLFAKGITKSQGQYIENNVTSLDTLIIAKDNEKIDITKYLDTEIICYLGSDNYVNNITNLQNYDKIIIRG